MARTRMKKKPAPHGFPEEVRVAAARRSGFRCEAGLKVCTSKAERFHHRKLRRSKDHSLANCLYVCNACHLHIHANPTFSYLMGLMVRQWAEPSEIPVKFGENAGP